MDMSQVDKKLPISMRNMRNAGVYMVPVSIVLAILGWYLITKIFDYPSYILPSPAIVWSRFVQVLGNGSLLRHLTVTLTEVLAGLAIGVLAATAIGYLLAKSHVFERLLSPYIIASQSIPLVAIAPLLVIWFGPGIFSKVLICALIVFFPVLVNTIVGLRSVPEELQDLMRSLQANRWQTIRLLDVPAALPVFLGGLRIGATLAVIGAVVGELVGADRGLGFLIAIGRGQFDTALVFVAVFALVTMAISLYGVVILLERHLLSWRQRLDQPTLTQ